MKSLPGWAMARTRDLLVRVATGVERGYPWAAEASILLVEFERLTLQKNTRRISWARAAGSARKETKRHKNAMHDAETAEIYRTCLERSKGECECHCGRPLLEGDRELDHVYGRGKVPQSVQNCWMLTRHCHRQKHNGRPSAAYWCELFIQHCKWHEYDHVRASTRLATLVAKEQMDLDRHGAQTNVARVDRG